MEKLILDAVLGLLSRNFCRTVISPSLRAREEDWVDLALVELKNNLSFLVTGADQEVAVFLKKLQDDLNFAAPEMAPDKIHAAFMEFREAIVAKGFRATCPIDASQEPVISDGVRPVVGDDRYRNGEFECRHCNLVFEPGREATTRAVQDGIHRREHPMCPECGRLAPCSK